MNSEYIDQKSIFFYLNTQNIVKMFIFQYNLCKANFVSLKCEIIWRKEKWALVQKKEISKNLLNSIILTEILVLENKHQQNNKKTKKSEDLVHTYTCLYIGAGM